jgi:hypothetical protein
MYLSVIDRKRFAAEAQRIYETYCLIRGHVF